MSAPPEGVKTLLSLILGLEHWRKGHGRFAFVDFESGPHTIRLLLDDLGATLEEIAEVLYFEPDAAPTENDLTLVKAAGVGLAIIDAAAGAYDASGLDDNKRADAETFSRCWVRPLWQRGITTVLVDHVVKNAENRGRYAIGSERKLGTVDVHLGLTVVRQLHRGATGLVRVATHKDRPAWLSRPNAAEIELRSDPETHAIRWEFRAPDSAQSAGDHWRPTELMAKVSAYLETQTEPVTRNTVERAIRGTATYVRQAMDELVAAGHAVETAGSRGSRLIAFVSPFPPTASDCVGTASTTRSSLLATASSASVSTTDDADAVDEAEIDRLNRVGQEMGIA
jgi:hypothetical protein